MTDNVLSAKLVVICLYIRRIYIYINGMSTTMRFALFTEMRFTNASSPVKLINSVFSG